MQGAPDNQPVPLPTVSGIPLVKGDFASFVEAVEYASGGAGGMNFYSARGEIIDQLSHKALRRDAMAVAGRMLAAGLKPGDRIGVLAETISDFARAFVGAFYAGLVPAPMPLPVAFGQREAYSEQIRRIAQTMGARAMFASPEFAEWVAEAMAPLNMAYTGPLGGLPEAAPIDTPPPTQSGDLAYLQFSSGTTGAPKGVAVTHGSMMANLQAIIKHGLKIGPEDRGVSWLPFYHDMGLVGCFLTPIATQLTADYMATRDFIRRPLLWLELMSRNGCTVTYAPSFGYDLAIRRARGKAPEGLDLSSWRVAGIGGDMIKAPVIRRFSEVFGPAGFSPGAFVPSYGMAETTLALTFTPLGEGLRTRRLDLAKLERDMVAAPAEEGAPARDFALNGPALPEHEIQIRDENGAPLPGDRVGRVFANGPSLMREYFGDEDATVEALKDGWLDTGDLGYLTGGELVITGRAKDLMIVNGRNIWPHDLEWSVEKEVEAIREGGAAAFSVTPDDSIGDPEEKVVVVVECRARDADAREAIRDEVHEVVRVGHGVEAKIALAGNGDLPQTSSGKLSRAKARLMYLDGAFDLGATG
ncbi:MAG: fatty acyl-AMP ligase [Pseudomonadota bacterium]